MEKFFGLVTDLNGNSIDGATITVLNYPSLTLADIFSNDGQAPLPNPFTATNVEKNGRYEFYAADGRYRINQDPPPTSGLSSSRIIDAILGDVAYLQKASKAEVAALPLTQYDAGKKIFITSDDGGQGTIRYDSSGGHSDDSVSYCGTKFIPTGGDGTIYWERDEVTSYNLRWYGAKGDFNGTTGTDDSTALQEAFNAVIANGGALYAPAGYYLINSRVSSSVDTGAAWDSGITIYGDGKAVTSFAVNNATGFFKWENLSARNIKLTVRDFTVVQAVGGNNGVTFEVYSAPGGNHHSRDLVMENIESVPLDNTTDYVTQFVKATGLWRPYFHNVSHANPFGPGVTTATQHQGTAVFDVPECYAPTFIDCHAWGCSFGYRHVVNENPGGEGFTIRSSVADSDVGIYLFSTGVEPGFEINTCHTNCATAGIKIEQKKFGTINNCLFYNEETTAYSDIQLIDCDEVRITDPQFQFTGNTNRINIDVDLDCTKIRIQNPHHRTDGTGIKLASGCDEIYIIRPWFDMTIVDTPISDLGATNLHVQHGDIWRAQASLSAGFTLTISGTSYSVDWDTQDEDNGAWFAPTDSRFIVPSNLGIRRVKIETNIQWASNSTGERTLRATLGGAGFAGQPEIRQAASATTQQHIASEIDVTDGSIVRLLAIQSSGGSLDIASSDSTWFRITAVDT